MYYVMIDMRDDWGKLISTRIGKYFKNVNSAIKLANKHRTNHAFVYKYGLRIPIYSTKPEVNNVIRQNNIA